MNYKYDKNNYLKILYGGTKIKLLIEKKLPINPRYEFRYINGYIVEKKIIGNDTEYKQQINLGDFFINDDKICFLKTYLDRQGDKKPRSYQCIYIERNMYVDRIRDNDNCIVITEDFFKTFQKLKFNKNSHNIELANQVLNSGFNVNDEVYVGEQISPSNKIKYKILEIKNTGTDACVKLIRFFQSSDAYTTSVYELFKLDISKFKHIDGRYETYPDDATSGPYEVEYGEGDDKTTSGSSGVDKKDTHPGYKSNELSRTIHTTINNVIKLLEIEREKY